MSRQLDPRRASASKAEAAYYRAVLAHKRAEAKLSVSDAIAEEVSTAVLGAEVEAAALPPDDPESAMAIFWASK